VRDALKHRHALLETGLEYQENVGFLHGVKCSGSPRSR
jgi:hypothetical protein